MKKGMTVVLDGNNYILVDSVTYSGEKYFASVSESETDNTIYFFKLIPGENGDSLELVDQNVNAKVVEALLQHIDGTF